MELDFYPEDNANNKAVGKELDVLSFAIIIRKVVQCCKCHQYGEKTEKYYFKVLHTM